MQLRPYQLEAVPALRDSRRTGKRRIVYVAATGSGKTTVTTELFKAAIAKGSRCLFITPRISLVRQTIKVFEANGLDPSIIWAGAPKSFVPHKNLQVACMQTLARRLKLPDFVAAFGEYSLTVADECHIICSEDYKDVLLSLAGEKATLIGLTATPWALGLDAIYEGIVSTITPAELVAQGYLTPCRAVTGEISLDLSNMKVERGDYKESDVRQAVEKDTVYADILKTYKEFAEGKRGVFFCAGKGHADALSKQFIEAGVPSAVVVAETPAEERDQIFDQCRSGDVLCLFSVDALSEGLDIPQIEVVGLCKPTKSLNKYIQRVGRGARTSPETGKEFFWLLDFVGAIAEHGLPFDERPYYFPAKARPKKKGEDDGEEEKEKTTWNCGSCRGINSKSSMTCNVCGARKPLPPPKVVLSIGVTMKEVTQGGKEVLASIKAKDQQVIYSALIGFLGTMGENPNCAYHTWHDHFGSYPIGLKKVSGKWVETAQGLRDTFIRKRIEWKQKQKRKGLAA